jgi:sugar/nucleoside kinase (ribokinase family)
MAGAVLVIVSSINVDVICSVQRLPAEHEKLMAEACRVAGGGSGANTAYWLAQLGLPVHVAGFTGGDVFGEFALGGLAAGGVDISACVRLENATTNIVSIFSSGAGKSMVFAGLKYGEEAMETLQRAVLSLDFSRIRHVHFATRDKVLLARMLEALGGKALSVSMELDGIYDTRLVSRADMVFSNMDELARATGAADPASFLAGAHAADKTAFLVTDGANGARIIRQGQIALIPTVRLAPADRTGGGDAFDAGVIAAYLRGESLEAGAGKGLALASLVIQGWGARPAVDAAALRRTIAG